MTFWIDELGGLWVGDESGIPEGSRPLTDEEIVIYGFRESLYTAVEPTVDDSE